MQDAGALRDAIADKDRAAGGLRRQLEAAEDARDAAASGATIMRRDVDRANATAAAAEAAVRSDALAQSVYQYP